MGTDRGEGAPVAAPVRGREAVDGLYETAYHELTRIASSCRAKDPFATLSTRTLLHESWLKFATADRLAVVDERHLKMILIHAMREVLVDAARRRRAAKRSGRVVALDEALALDTSSDDTILAVHDALGRLAALDETQAAVVEARFFGGANFDEIGAALGVSESTARRHWLSARALLQTWFADPPRP